MKPSVCIAIGTRPEAIKLAPAIAACRNRPDLDTRVVTTGQHREMVAQVMDLFGLAADANLDIMQPGQTLTDITCRSMRGLEALWDADPPSLVLVQGDTTTAMAAALTAFYRRIPVGHVEAGLRSFDLANPFPEEANRRLIGQIAQLHFAPTAAAVANLKRSAVLGEIHLTGNTVIDALLATAAARPECPVEGLDWEQHRVLLSTVHRRENWGEPLQSILASFAEILERFPDTALLLPLHRNPTVRDPIRAALGDHPRAFLVEPLDYVQLIGAIQRCTLLLTDSGGLQEEAPGLGKPVLVLRETTERPEAIAAGTAKLVGTDRDRIAAAASDLLQNEAAYRAMANAVNPFGDGRASDRIAYLIATYLGVEPGPEPPPLQLG